MNRKSFKTIFFLTVIFLSELNCFAEKGTFSWDFSDCEVGDILFAVSLDTGISIVSDDTVSGKADFRFAGGDFETAFDSFLKGARLYVEKKEKVWTVSRWRLVENDGLFVFDACDMTPCQILEKISLCCEKAINYDVLPVSELSLHLRDVTEAELMNCVAARFGDFEVIDSEESYSFVRKRVEALKKEAADCLLKIEKTENGYEVDLRNARFSEVLETLFENEKLEEKKDFCLLSNGDVRISRCCFFEEEFDSVLEKICLQNGFCCLKKDGIYYVAGDSAARDKLLLEKREWVKFTLRFVKGDKAVSFIVRRFGKLEYMIPGDEYTFMANVTESEKQIILDLLKDIDVQTGTYRLDLRFVTPEVFVRSLPEIFDKSNLFFGEGNSFVYFVGTKEAYEELCRQRDVFDVPVQRISYDLLILQSEENVDNNWSSSLGVNVMKAGDRNSGAVQLGSVMNLSLNVISAFGLEFAARLQGALECNQTKVYADTRLHGVSGKEICFQNTNTYRYRDNNLDPDTGKPVYSGVTREIVSGLKLDVVGVISGDGMVTSRVTASITRRGTDTSSYTGNPPPTTEKVVTTEVCARDGEPVVLSGLIQNADTSNEEGTPLFSKIPVLGWLFKAKEKQRENTQFVIYLVPHIEAYGSIYKKNAEDENFFFLKECKKLVSGLKETCSE